MDLKIQKFSDLCDYCELNKVSVYFNFNFNLIST